jgi:hypothetical protein
MQSLKVNTEFNGIPHVMMEQTLALESAVFQAKTLLPHRKLPPLLNQILSSGLLRGVKWFETDVLGLHIGPIFKTRSLEDETIGNPKTWVSNRLTPFNNPEDERIE